MNSVENFFNNTTTQFYVVLTGTSSLISGILTIIEWLHYTVYGISIMERLASLLYSFLPTSLVQKQQGNAEKQKKLSEAKPISNSLSLFRGSELYRYETETGRTVLTEYDKQLSTIDYLNIFTYEGVRLDNNPAQDLMITAFKEKDRYKRIKTAQAALVLDSGCIPALVLLAEEETQGLIEVEDLLKQASRAAEAAYRQSMTLCQHDPVYKPLHEHNANISIHCRLRLAVCLRRLGKVKEATKIYRELLKDNRVHFLVNIYENLAECLLEAQSYTELNAFLLKQEDSSIYKSTVLCFTIALLKAKAVGDKFCTETVARRGPTPQELSACEAIHRAVELNPLVPKYLLELKPLVPPPEHYIKRGDSEAVTYAFHHLVHWKRIEGAIPLLSATWEGTFQRIPFPLERGHLFPPYPTYTEVVDKELLPQHHEVLVFPQKDTPFFMVFTGVLCFSFMTLTVIAYHFPQAMTQYAKTVTTVFLTIVDKLLPRGILGFY